MEEQKRQIIEKFGLEKGARIIKLQTNLDLYMIRFKREMNELLKEHGYEVLCGVAYKEKDE
jgi:hypothetical protein